jgi:mannonate dehydratase
MRRRDFFELSAALAAGQAARAKAAAPPMRMKLGTQHGESDDILTAMAAFGVNHISAHTPSKQLDEKWSVEALTRLRERIEKFGLTLEMIELPTNSYHHDQRD